MNGILASILLILVSGQVIAKSSSRAGGRSVATYDMYAPKDKSIQLSLGLNTVNSETTTKIPSVTTKGSGLGQNLNFAYGISDKVSIFINQDVYDYTYETAGIKSTVKSVAPTEIGFKGILNFGGPFLYYNLSYTSALLEKRDDSGGLNVFWIRDSRDYFMPTIGFGFPAGILMFGAKYDQYISIKTENTFSGLPRQFDASPGYRWKAYLQFDLGSKIGFSYSEEIFDPITVFSNGSIVAFTVQKTEVKFLQLYAIVPVGAMTNILFDIQKINLKDESAYSKYDSYIGKTGAQFNF